MERKITVEWTAFTSMVRCEHCNVNFRRANRQYKGNKKKIWICQARQKQGKQCGCGTNEILEEILEATTAEVLGLTVFDAEIFKAQIKQIVVPSKNRLVYHFNNGKIVTRDWKSTARIDCWTPERRAALAQRSSEREISEAERAARSEWMKAHYAANPERRIADSERMKKFCAENPDWGVEQNKRLMTRHKEIKEEKARGLR